MAGVLEPGVLLATKLHVPRSRPGHVARPLLIGRLAEGIESSGLVLVCSPCPAASPGVCLPPGTGELRSRRLPLTAVFSSDLGYA
jgi:hypothetical protein